MTVNWTQHRFSGGVLALDTTNTVVHRGNPAQTFDRFDDRTEIRRFAQAASLYRAEEFAGSRIEAAEPERIAAQVIAIRETTDALFRAAAATGAADPVRLPDFLRACADGLESGSAGGVAGRPMAFEAALAVSALSLLSRDAIKKLRVCPNCNWLFLDRSRNRSRLWCDMTVCGNRQKARRHYQRRKALSDEVGDV